MRGNIVRSEEWVVMRYSSVLDLHTHTLVSGHAYCSLREMAKAAADKGLEVLDKTYSMYSDFSLLQVTLPEVHHMVSPGKKWG